MNTLHGRDPEASLQLCEVVETEKQQHVLTREDLCYFKNKAGVIFEKVCN